MKHKIYIGRYDDPAASDIILEAARRLTVEGVDLDELPWIQVIDATSAQAGESVVEGELAGKLSVKVDL